MQRDQRLSGHMYGINVNNGETTAYLDGKPVQTLIDTHAKPRILNNRTARRSNPGIFLSSKIKLQRAVKHLWGLDAELRAFLKTEPYVFLQYRDEQSGENVYLVRVKNDIPVGVSGVVGDIVHNLRAALDHLVCDLIRANPAGGGKSDASNGQFPIRKTGKDAKSRPTAKIKGISNASKLIIERLTKCEQWNSLAWTLHWLDIVDKHNRILTSAAANVSTTVEIGVPGMFVGPDGSLRIGGPGPGGKPFLAKASTPAKFEQVFPIKGTSEIHRSAYGFTEAVEIGIDTVFHGNVEAEGKSVFQTLNQLYVLVSRTIDIFERFGPKGGELEVE